MANEREEGLTALQNGDFQAAQTKLEAAIAQDAQDAQAHLYLGGVYHQLKRHTDAVRVLTRATELMPMSAQARYNLGIAQEALGANQQALDAYRQAISLQPSYPLAQQGLERMQKAIAAAQAAPPAMPSVAPTNAPVYGAPPAGQPYVPNQPQPVTPYPANQTQAMPPYPGQPNAVPPLGQPAYQQPAAYGQPAGQPGGYAPSQPVYAPPQQYDLAGNPIAPTQPTYAPQPGGQPGGYAPGPAGSYRGPQWSPQAAQTQSTKEDFFSVGQAFSDIFQLLISPSSFFADEEGATGFAAPLAMLLAYSLIIGLLYCVYVLYLGSSAGPAGFIALFFVLLIIPIVFVGYLICNLIWAGIVHLVSRMFGGSGEYSGTFRAAVYMWAPVLVLSSIGSLIGVLTMPKPTITGMVAPQTRLVRAQYGQNPYGQPSYGAPNSGFGGQNSSNPYGSSPYGNSTYGGSRYGSTARSPYAGNPAALIMQSMITLVFNGIGILWGYVLLGMGVRATQRMSAGGAAGTVIISVLVPALLFFGLIVVAGMAAMH